MVSKVLVGYRVTLSDGTWRDFTLGERAVAFKLFNERVEALLIARMYVEPIEDKRVTVTAHGAPDVR